jgi:hypothetical protein
MYRLKAGNTKEGCKPDGRDNWAPCAGQAPFDKPALKPYWGKPTVRNFRGDDGNVGIIRSPLRAIVLPDNRHEAENERVSRERSSDPLGLESCVATARDPTKRRQRIGGLGIQLRKDAIWTPTPLICAEGNMSRSASASSRSVRRSRRPQTRLETSCTRTGRPRRHLRSNQTAGRRAKA